MNVLFNHDFWRLENQFQYITHLKIISQCICISYFLSCEVKQNRFVNYDSTTVSYTCRNNIFYAFCLQKQNNFCWFFKSSLLQIVNLGITGKIAAGHVRFQIMDINANSDVIARHTCAMLQVGANNASIFYPAFLYLFIWRTIVNKLDINTTITDKEIYFFLISRLHFEFVLRH